MGFLTNILIVVIAVIITFVLLDLATTERVAEVVSIVVGLLGLVYIARRSSLEDRV